MKNVQMSNHGLMPTSMANADGDPQQEAQGDDEHIEQHHVLEAQRMRQVHHP
ncbi:MAG: hypothetical protein R3F60_04765 [bacterium]